MDDTSMERCAKCDKTAVMTFCSFMTGRSYPTCLDCYWIAVVDDQVALAMLIKDETV